MFVATLVLYRVRTGHGKPGKSWNFRISFSRPGKSEFKCGSWENDVYQKVQNKLEFFREENGKILPKMKDDFQENGQI